MADIELVIKIDEETYKDIKNGKVYSSMRDVPQESVLAIQNGTPLPKGHGRLGDLDRLYDVFKRNIVSADAFKDLFNHAPTIIEADKGVE